MLNFANLTFCYDPYPIGLAQDILEGDFYRQLTKIFPSPELFEYKELLGHKYSLSELNNPGLYHEFINANEPWKQFHRWIKRKAFPHEIVEMLLAHNIDLNVTRPSSFAGNGALLNFLKLGRRAAGSSLNARFEFSMLPADGGCIKPHTDQPRKIVTLVVSMSGEGEWNSTYGGETEVMRPKDIRRNYNFVNQQLEFDEVETIRVFEYKPNQGVVFIKTFNSLHGVRPMTGLGSNLMRKTLTINIEHRRH